MPSPQPSAVNADTILHSLAGYLFWKDRQSIYIGCNHAFAKLIGLDNPAHIYGRSDYQLPWSMHADFFIKGDQDVINGKVILHQEEHLTLTHQPPATVVVTKTPLKDHNGTIIGVLGSARNSTQAQQEGYKLATFAPTHTNNPRLLIVEDSPGVRAVYSHFFKSLNVAYHMACDGNSALQILKEHSFDLILLDIGLPDMSGVKLAEIIRTTTTTPMVAITAHATAAIKQECLAVGIKQVLVKPLSLEQAKQLIQQVS